jgi:hypothetical protein
VRSVAIGLSLAIAGPLAPGATGASTPHPAGPCRVVVGGAGEIPASSDTAQNDFWNRLNFSFYDAAQYALSTGGREALGMFFVVGAPDGAKPADAALAKAASAGCSEVVRLRVFGDEEVDPPALVFRISVAPVERVPGGGESGWRLGATRYAHDYRFASTPDVERRVVPSEVGEKAVAGYLDSAARPSR